MAGREAATVLGTASTSSSVRTPMTMGRRQLLRRGILGLMVGLAALFGQVTIGGILPVAAYDDCQWVGNSSGTNGSDWTCTYTQYGGSANDWPGASPGTGGGTYPKCGNNCTWWPSPNGYYDQVPYSNSLVNNSTANFHDDAAKAVNDWSGQPYNSPLFYRLSPEQHVQQRLPDDNLVRLRREYQRRLRRRWDQPTVRQRGRGRSGTTQHGGALRGRIQQLG